MPEHSEVDEIVGEARKFSAAMMAAIKRHSQATGWLERRKARKDISRLVRQERREQDQARTDSLAWTTQAVDRYRAHSLAVAARAHDPRVDRDRRDRDAAALAGHRQDLAEQFLDNRHLTRVEQGIALDGLDAATVFPEFKAGDLFGRAHKVKGLEALRYRAQVARENAARNGRAAERASSERELDAAGRANREQQELTRIEKAQPDQHRYRAQMVWRDGRGEVGLSEVEGMPTERVATSWMARSIGQSLWTEGTTVEVSIIDREGAATRYSEAGRPEIVADQLDAREAMLRERTLAGHVHRDPPAPTRESTRAQQDSGRFDSFVTYWPEGDNAVQNLHGRHSNEIEAAAWTSEQVSEIAPKSGSAVLVSSFYHDRGGHHEQVFYAEGGRQFIADEVSQWSDAAERAWWDNAERTPDQRTAEHITAAVAADRDQLQRQLDSLDQRHRLSIEHNGELTDRNAELTRQMAALTAERDELRGQRDEAVRKLVERTPATERFGSPQRQARQAKDHAHEQGGSALAGHQAGSALADAMARNGHDREGLER